MITVGGILDYVRSLNPSGKLGQEEGVLYGETGAEVSGIRPVGVPATST